MDVEIVEETGAGKDFSKISEGDVVIFPAFGATVQEMALFRDKGVQMVDTTCPWVAKVWNSVDNHTKKEFTSVIHGKYYHEETIATASFASRPTAPTGSPSSRPKAKSEISPAGRTRL